MLRLNFINHAIFGIKKQADKAFFNRILQDTNMQFLKWAVGAILNWKSVKSKKHVITIHGSKDYLLPAAYPVDYTIHGAGHFMIVTHREKVQYILDKILNNNKLFEK